VLEESTAPEGWFVQCLSTHLEKIVASAWSGRFHTDFHLPPYMVIRKLIIPSLENPAFSVNKMKGGNPRLSTHSLRNLCKMFFFNRQEAVSQKTCFRRPLIHITVSSCIV
jgi:hypothetical protein